MATAILTQSALKEILHYDPGTGVFTWRVSLGTAKAGSVAGSFARHGYVQIGVAGRNHLAHRLAWLYEFGEFPPNDLDHINRVRSDNRICNLRPATNAENNQNCSMRRDNTSGHVGVYWYKRDKKWRAKIQINRKTIPLGRFTNLEGAIAARKAAELKYHTFKHPL